MSHRIPSVASSAILRTSQTALRPAMATSDRNNTIFRQRHPAGTSELTKHLLSLETDRDLQFRVGASHLAAHYTVSCPSQNKSVARCRLSSEGRQEVFKPGPGADATMHARVGAAKLRSVCLFASETRCTYHGLAVVCTTTN
jgi:hypothetical protein